MLKKAEPVGRIEDIIRDDTTPGHRVLCVTSVISEVKTLDELLGCKVTHTPLMLNRACAVIIHGNGRPARKAMSASTALELPLLHADFGPFKTFNHKKHQALSMTFDHLGGVNASDRETYLESLIKHQPDASEVKRTEQLITQWKAVRASKYNHNSGPELPAERFVVVIAEPTPLGGNIRESAEVTMNLKARAAKVFPGHRAIVLPAATYAADVLEQADAAFVHSSPVGLEALIWGTPLYVSGMPFYAGWGLTEDELPAPARRNGLQTGLAQLIYAYVVRYSRYVSPFDSKRLTPEETLELLHKTRPDALAEAQVKKQQNQRLPTWLHWLWR